MIMNIEAEVLFHIYLFEMQQSLVSLVVVHVEQAVVVEAQEVLVDGHEVVLVLVVEVVVLL